MIRILILDDEELICKTLDMMLRRMEGIGQVHTDLFCDGAEALEALRKESYDIALTDLRMPNMDGLAFMEEARSLPTPPKLVVISAYGDFAYVKGAFKSGAFDYLMKPITFHELQEVILKCLEIEQKQDDQAVIEDILQFMENNIERNLSLSDVAGYASMEYSYFSSYFKRKTGKSFSACLQDMKNRHAQKLLAETDMGIEELALRMGYSSGGNFSRAFRRGTGQWPSEYRKTHRHRG